MTLPLYLDDNASAPVAPEVAVRLSIGRPATDDESPNRRTR